MAERYKWPTLPVGDIVAFFRDHSVEITENDIRKPEPHRLKKLYNYIIEMVTGHPSEQARQPLLYNGPQHDFPELHEEDNQLLFFYHDLNRIMMACAVRDFEPWDIIEPSPRRLISILSGVINFMRFRNSRMEVFETLKNANEHYQDQRDALQKMNKELDQRVTRSRSILTEQQPRTLQVQNDIEILTGQMEGLHKQHEFLQKAINEKKKEICEKKTEKDQLKVQILNAEKDKDDLALKIFQSPERVKQEQEKQMSKVASLKTLLAEKHSRLAELRQRRECMQKVEDNPDQTIKLLHSIQQSFNKENEEERKKIQLRDRIGENGRLIGEAQRQQEKLRNKKLLLQEKLNKVKLQHQAKMVAIKSQKEDLDRQQEQYCKGGDQKILKSKLQLLDDIHRVEQETAQMQETSATLYSEIMQKVDQMHADLGKALAEELQK